MQEFPKLCNLEDIETEPITKCDKLEEVIAISCFGKRATGPSCD